MRLKKLSLRDICLIGIFTALTAVCAQISVPMPFGVPMTLQTLILPLAGIVLGPRKGTLSTAVYILTGALGVPVFAGFRGGFGVILGPTGGFILSFPLIALAAGIGAGKKSVVWYVSGLLAGAALNYACGMFFYSLVTSNTLRAAFTACVLPFLPAAAVKIVLAGVSGRKIKSVLNKRVLRTN